MTHDKPPGFLLVDQYIPSYGKVAIDCGANVGKWTRPLAEIFDKVIAIEPDPRACARSMCNLPENAEIIQAAVGAEKGKLDFSLMPKTKHSFLGKWKEAVEHIVVNVLTLDDFLDYEVDFVKVDVEGNEVNVIQGAESLIRTRRPMMVIELHSGTEDKVKKAMSKFDYQLHLCGRQLACVPK